MVAVTPGCTASTTGGPADSTILTSIATALSDEVTDMLMTSAVPSDPVPSGTEEMVPNGWHQTYRYNVDGDPNAVCITLMGEFEFFFQYQVSIKT